MLLTLQSLVDVNDRSSVERKYFHLVLLQSTEERGCHPCFFCRDVMIAVDKSLGSLKHILHGIALLCISRRIRTSDGSVAHAHKRRFKSAWCLGLIGRIAVYVGKAALTGSHLQQVGLGLRKCFIEDVPSHQIGTAPSLKAQLQLSLPEWPSRKHRAR